MRPIGESAVAYAKERSEREPAVEIRVWDWPIPGSPYLDARGYAVRSELEKDFPGGTIVRRFKAGKESTDEQSGPLEN